MFNGAVFYKVLSHMAYEEAGILGGHPCIQSCAHSLKKVLFVVLKVAGIYLLDHHGYNPTVGEGFPRLSRLKRFKYHKNYSSINNHESNT